MITKIDGLVFTIDTQGLSYPSAQDISDVVNNTLRIMDIEASGVSAKYSTFIFIENQAQYIPALLSEAKELEEAEELEKINKRRPFFSPPVDWYNCQIKLKTIINYQI